MQRIIARMREEKTAPCKINSSTNVRKTIPPHKMNKKHHAKKASAQTNQHEITHFKKKKA